MHLSTRQKEVPQNYPIRVNLNTGLFGQNKGQAYPLSGKVLKNKAVFPVHLGEIKGLLIAIQHWEILMTDLGLSCSFSLMKKNQKIKASSASLLSPALRCSRCQLASLRQQRSRPLRSGRSLYAHQTEASLIDNDNGQLTNYFYLDSLLSLYINYNRIQI